MVKKIILIIFCLFMVKPVIAEDYSSDFEYNMSAWEESIIATDNYVESFTGRNSPSARYNSARDAMEYREMVKKIENRVKYTYRPYSPNVYQKRQTYDPRNVDWSNH